MLLSFSQSEDEREMCVRTVYCTNIDKRVIQFPLTISLMRFCLFWKLLTAKVLEQLTFFNVLLLVFADHSNWLESLLWNALRGGMNIGLECDNYFYALICMSSALQSIFFCYISFVGSSSEAWRLSPPNPYCFCWVCDGNSLCLCFQLKCSHFGH